MTPRTVSAWDSKLRHIGDRIRVQIPIEIDLVALLNASRQRGATRGEPSFAQPLPDERPDMHWRERALLQARRRLLAHTVTQMKG